LTVAELLQQPPAADRGVLIGVGDWRLVVEVLLPAEVLGLWGIARWGEQQWNVYAWQDLTEFVRGLEWTRGADEYLGRPRVGQASITLDNTDGRWSPFAVAPPVGSAAYFAPGTLIRCGVRSATDTRAEGWIPQFCVITDSWGETYAGVGSDRYIDVTGFETLRDLASIDDNALPGLVGGGEFAKDRFARLLDAAGWKYGLTIDADNVAGDNYPLVSTDMAANRLAECYQVADSSDSRFRSSRKGDALVENLEYTAIDRTAAVWPLIDFSLVSSTPINPGIGFRQVENHTGISKYVPYDADSFAAVSEDSHIINDARFARQGGTQQVHQQPASIARHGLRTLVRNDFLNTSDAQVLVIAAYTSERRGLNVLRVKQLDVATSDRGDLNYLATIAADLYVFCTALPPGYSTGGPFITGFVESMTHRVTPRSNGAVTWSTRFGIATRIVWNLPAAQLPNNPLD
jgi:hypothetical protein